MRQDFKYDLLCRKFKQFFRSHFDLISRYSNLSLNTYTRASIVRFSEPVVIVATRARVVGAAVAFSDLDFRLHWYLSHSL